MRKLAMLLAAILTLNLAAPAASVYAAPTETVVETVVEEMATEDAEEGNAASATVIEETVETGTDESSAEEVQSGETMVEEDETATDASEETEEETAVTEETSVWETEEETTEEGGFIGEKPMGLTIPADAIELEDSELYLQTKYYNTANGYPVFGLFDIPVASDYSTTFTVKALSLAIDDGQEKELTVAKTIKTGLAYENGKYSRTAVGFGAGYDSFTEGIHKLTFSAVISDGTNDYYVSASKEAEFVDDYNSSTLIYPESISDSSKNYMSAFDGARVRMVYNCINATSKTETIKKVKLRNYDTKQEYDISWDKAYEPHYSSGQADCRYHSFGSGIYINTTGLITDKNLYHLYQTINFTLEENVPEGYYDIILVSSSGKNHILEKRYYATEKPVVYEVCSSGVMYKSSDNSGTTNGVPIDADNTGDYVSLFVYGLNLSKDTIPVFYDTEQKEIFTDFVTDDVICATEEWDWGLDYTLKKKDASADVWKTKTNFVVQLDQETIWPYTEDGYGIFSYSASMLYRCEYNTYDEYLRVFLSPEYVEEGERITVSGSWDYWDIDTGMIKGDSRTDSGLVTYNGKEYFVEFSKKSELYKEYYNCCYDGFVAEKEDGTRGFFQPNRYREIPQVTNVTVPANCTWEIYASKDVGNPVFSGKTTENKKVLTASQVNELAQYGVHRVCIYDANGNIIDGGHYEAFFKGERLYNIKYVLDGGENHPDNPAKYSKSETVVLQAPTKEYHVFKGWYSDAKMTKKVTKIAKGSTGDKTFYAKWEPYKYTVTYHANGGKGKTKATTHVYNENMFFAKNGFARTGYSFVCWNGREDGNGVCYHEGVEYPPLTSQNGATVPVYALWEPITYTIILDSNSDVALDGIVEAGKNAFEIEYDGYFELTGKEYERKGYTIASWNTKANGKGKKVANGEVANLTTKDGDTITLYAQWAIEKYNINIDYDGGKVKKANPKTYTYETADITLNVPTKTGYVFEGYYTVDPDSDAFTGEETPVTVIPKGSQGDITLYAKWRPISYTIIFKDVTGAEYTDGFSDETARVQMLYDGVLTFTDSLFVKKGYTLSSWNSKENGKGTKYAVGRGYGNLTAVDGAEITVYAQWTKDVYTINYNLDGGKNDKSNPKKYSVDTATITLKEPVKTGFYFTGWYAMDESGQLSEEAITEIASGSTGNLELVATWETMAYSITLNPNDDKYLAIENREIIDAGIYDYTMDVIPKDWNELYIPTEEYKNQGIGILYWSTKANGGGKKYYPGKTYSGLATEGTVTLYAQWGLKKYEITYVGAEDVKNTNPASFTYHESKKIVLKDLKKTGYLFNGWYTDGSLEEAYKVTEISRDKCEDITLYASFTMIRYKVKLNANATDAVPRYGLMYIIPLSYTQEYELEADSYTRNHYRIAYWSTKANGKGTKIMNGEPFSKLSATNDATVNLYPKWELVDYNITYHYADTEDVVNKNPSTYHYSKKDLKLKNPTRTGYIFGGWYNEDTEAADFDKETSMRIEKIAKYTGQDIELYALWTPVSYKVKLEANAKDAMSGSIVIGQPMETVALNYGNPLYLPGDAYMRKGYTLKEFNTKKNGKGISFTLDEHHVIPATKDGSTVKVFAIWEKVKTQRVEDVILTANIGNIVVDFASNEDCDGYEVAISPYFTMYDAQKCITTEPFYSFSDLESGKRYYVRVRAIRYDSTGTAVYGPWSSLKTVVTHQDIYR